MFCTDTLHPHPAQSYFHALVTVTLSLNWGQKQLSAQGSNRSIPAIEQRSTDAKKEAMVGIHDVRPLRRSIGRTIKFFIWIFRRVVECPMIALVDSFLSKTRTGNCRYCKIIQGALLQRNLNYNQTNSQIGNKIITRFQRYSRLH